MYIKLVYAMILTVMLIFPFTIDMDAVFKNTQSINSTAVVDSAIIKHYSQTGSLPQTLDVDTLKQMGLNEEAVKGMTYEKLTDRKFVLSFADTKNNKKESIHSRTELPVNVNTNFGEVTENTKYHWLEVPHSANQKVIVVVTLPDGSKIELQEGERKEFPTNSDFSVNIVPDEGYSSGSVNMPSGKINRDIILSVSEAKLNTYSLEVGTSSTQNVVIDVNDIKNNKRFEIRNGEKVTVAHGAQFSLKEIKALAGYLVGSINPSSGTVINNTFIEIIEGRLEQHTVSVADTVNQTITVTIKGSDGKTYTVKNSQSVVVPYGSTLTATIKADQGYTAGTLNITSATITGNVVVNATEAKKEIVPVNPLPEKETLLTEYYWSDSMTPEKVVVKIPPNVNVVKLIYNIGQAGDDIMECNLLSPNKKWWVGYRDNWNYWHESMPKYIKVTSGATYIFEATSSVVSPPIEGGVFIYYSKDINNHKVDFEDLL